jgi:hypothetical protein
MIYSTICTWDSDGNLAFEPCNFIEHRAHNSIAEAMAYRLTRHDWQPATESQAVRFDKWGFMDVITYVEMENEL